MSDLLRHILAVICMVAFITSGQASACLCQVAPAEKSACSGEGHNHGPEHQDHAPNADPTCPCAACHTCHHMQVALPESIVPEQSDVRSEPVSDVSMRPIVRSGDIFNPPKLS